MVVCRRVYMRWNLVLMMSSLCVTRDVAVFSVESTQLTDRYKPFNPNHRLLRLRTLHQRLLTHGTS